jgi:hypothetical protein
VKGSEAYGKIRGVLLRYGSTITVDSMLKVAMSHLDLSSDRLDEGDLERLISELSAGIRLFCDPARVPDMMLELADLLE